MSLMHIGVLLLTLEPLPNWPEKLPPPQLYSFPLLSKANALASLKNIFSIFLPLSALFCKSLMHIGKDLLSVNPFPNWPLLLSPHAYTFPLSSMARTLPLSDILICFILFPFTSLPLMSLMHIGLFVLVFVPFPNCPS